jgi:hypothetical protein
MTWHVLSVRSYLEAAARRLVQIVQGRGVSKPVLVSLGLTPKLEVGTMR